MKSGGLILWNVTVICEMLKTAWQAGKHLMKDASENHLKVQQFLLAQWLNIIRFLHKTSPGFINLARKFCQECSSICIYRGKNLDWRYSGCRH